MQRVCVPGEAEEAPTVVVARRGRGESAVERPGGARRKVWRRGGGSASYRRWLGQGKKLGRRGSLASVLRGHE